MEIIPCHDRLEELVKFAARLNGDGMHHIGFFGEGEVDIRAALAECIIPPGDGFRLGYEEEKLIGIFGVDADPEINRAWLFGPLVEHDDWHRVADQLYAEVLALIPAGIREYDLFCDVQNTRLEAFALRHGFALGSENAVLTLVREKYKSPAKGNALICSYQEQYFEQLDHLHKTLFPKAYFTARQMVEKADRHRQLFLAVEDGKLTGYHFCKIEPEAESGYVDFIGTDVSVRGRGIGADLLAAGVDWMFSIPTTKKIDLTVNANNVPARTLYEAFGFDVERIMRGYRKQVT
jgi:RimJ/RimL family protein N-acetyltransferase